jgi:hypothetical protein
MSADYNTLTGIEAYVARGLVGLRELARDRHAAGYERRERLNNFYVLGRFQLDTCGNMSEATAEFIPGVEIPELSPVMTHEEFWECIKLFCSYTKRGNACVGFAMGESWIPTNEDVCPVCERGWTIKTISDRCYDKHSKEPKFYHKNCYSLRAALNEKALFERLLQTAGFTNFLLHPIPNEYWANLPDTYWASYWFKVETPFGTFKLGRRKRVWNLDWSDTSLREIISDDAVTKEVTLIHAWKEEDLQKYLSTLCEKLKTVEPT